MTPPGVAAIAVVRMVGEDAREFVQRHFSRELRLGRAVHGEFRDDSGEVIDDPVIVLDPQQRFIDINLHGGAWVVSAVLDLSRRNGFEVVAPNDPPLHPDSVDADDVLSAEMLQYLPLARTELAVRALLAQPRAWEQLKSRWPLDRGVIQRILDDRALHWLLHPPHVAIIGAPNVGKSTLANQLFAQERSITADLPGTTRDWVGEIANLDGLAVMLVDTPGVRETPDPIEAEAIARSGQQVGCADLIVLVLDVTRPLEPEQSRLLKRYRDVLLVANKVDLPAAWDVAPLRPVRTDARRGTGIEELRRAIRQYFGCENLRPDQPRWWTPRQQEVLDAAIGTPDRLRELWMGSPS